MKYIKKIILINFQSHKHTEMVFDKHLNVIVGPSDHGKSSIIRALKWALFNRPSGDFFIREGETECSVTVLFSDGVKIERFRSTSKNAYYLYDHEGEKTTFEGFGTTVPQEIIDKTSMREVTLDTRESNIINIADQLEGPFLLSEKNSTRANSIGRLVGVHIVDDALKETLKDTRNLNIKKSNYENNLYKLEEDLKKYNYLDNLIKNIKKVEKIKNTIKRKQLNLDELKKKLVSLRILDKEIQVTKNYLEKIKHVDSVIEIEKNLVIKIDLLNFINKKYKTLNKVKKQAFEDKKLIKLLKDIERIEFIVNDIKENSEKVFIFKNMSKNYKHIKANISNNNKRLLELKDIQHINDNLNSIEIKNKNLNTLINLKNKRNSLNKSLFIGNNYIDKLSSVNKISRKYNLLKEQNIILEKLINYNKKYKSVKYEKIKTKKFLAEINLDISKELKKYKTILANIEICPLCFSNIDNMKVDKIINNLL